MQKLFLATGVFLIVPLPLFAQSVAPAPAPDDVVLKLEVEGGGQQFHLGELIPIKFSYRAETPGRYIWVSQSSKLTGGWSFEISCSPPAESISPHSTNVDNVTFGQMLAAPCGGAGAGTGGDCGDCDSEYSLNATPFSFGVVPLNAYIHIRTPGTYTCEASSADITASAIDEKIRPALQVKSNPIVLTIFDDAGWAHSAAIAYAAAYEKFCSNDDVAQHRSLQCFDVARRIAYLDTADSLATEVKWFDGRSHGWDNGFWNALQQSSQPQEALLLMTSRMQEPDFQASTNILEWLASSDLRIEMPEAFQRTPATYHAQAVDVLRKYVRLLGSSLAAKDPNVLEESVRTYRNFAEQNYCEQQSLIPADEQNQVLAGFSAKP